MGVIEVEHGIQLLFTEHGAGVQLSERDAMETVAVIAEAIAIANDGHFKNDEIELSGSVVDGITIRIKRMNNRSMI